MQGKAMQWNAMILKRSLNRAMLKGCPAPEPYWAQVPVHDPTTGRNDKLSHYITLLSHWCVSHPSVLKKKKTGASAWPQHWEEWQNGQHSLHPAPWALAQSAPQGSWPSGCFEWKSAGARSRKKRTKRKQTQKRKQVCKTSRTSSVRSLVSPLTNALAWVSLEMVDWQIDWWIDS